jgi:hypothetical protein
MPTASIALGQAGRLADRLAAARRGRFVGREAELALFRTALLADEPPFAVLYIYGPGGVGKTTLLREYARLAAESERPIVLLDGRDIDPSPIGFRLALHLALGLTEDVPSLTIPNWLPAGVLLIDTYEALAPLDSWLRESFLPQLPAQSLVVIAGRNPPEPAWRTDLDWAELTHIVSLRNLRPEESQTYLTVRGISDEHHPDVLAFSQGHPLALSLLADLLSQSSQPATIRPQAEPDVVRVLLERFLRDVPSPHHRRALEACAHARVTTEALLADVLGAAQAHELFMWLRGLSFIEQGPHGLFPHDLARDVLDTDLRWRNPESYRQLCGQVRRFIVRQLQESSGLEQQQAIYDWLFLQRYNSVARLYLELSSLGSIYAEPATEQDHPAILEMVQRHEGERSVQIARYWLQRQPQAFTVFRTADQQPSGFFAILVFQAATPEDLETDPALKAAWAFVQRYSALRPGEEFTYKRFWMEREGYQPAPSTALNLVSMISVRQWLTRPKLAWSFAVYADPDRWEPLYAHISFQRAPEADFELGGQRNAVFAHDWRVEPAPVWLEVMAERELATEIRLGIPEAKSSTPLVVLSQSEFAEAVRQALRDYTRPDLLATNLLMRSRLVIETAGEEADQAVLQALLRQAAATLMTHPKETKYYRALWHTYFEPAPTHERVAELLDLPFNTYRYHLAKGIERITTWLWQRELAATSH